MIRDLDKGGIGQYCEIDTDFPRPEVANPAGRDAFEEPRMYLNQVLQGQGIGQLAGLNPYQGITQQSIGQGMGVAVAPPTLTRALSSVEELNKRLLELSDKAERLATTIGGPFPMTGTAGDGKDVAPTSAMSQLNDEIDAAQLRVSGLSNAIDAMARALGING